MSLAGITKQAGKRRRKMNKDYIHNLWKRIVSELSKAKDIPTLRLKTTKAIYFSAHSESGRVVISKSKIKQPSSTLKKPIKISEEKFSEIYPYYQPWKKGEIQRQSMQDLPRITSYILALINNFEKEV